MSTRNPRGFTVRSARQTAALAQALATTLPPCAILLEGDLGAGKTTFVKAFVAALPGGAAVVVQSPTYGLLRSYATTPPVRHLDLYRLADASAASDLGLDDAIADPTSFALIEWPKEAPTRSHLRVQIALRSGSRRRITISAVGLTVDDAALGRALAGPRAAPPHTTRA